MKKAKRWLVILGIAGLAVVGGFLALSYYGARFIQARLQQAMGPGLRVEEIKIRPTHLSLKGLQYEDPNLSKRFFQIGEVDLYPGLFSSLTGSLQIRKCIILKPSFFLYRSRDGTFMGPLPKAGKGKEGDRGQGEERKGEKPSMVKIDRLQIQEGTLDFEDQKTEGPTAYIQLRDVDLEMKDLRYPFVPIHSPIELSGTFQGMTQEGSISAKGWVDLQTADMEMVFKTRQIDIKSFEPYYRKRVTAEISSGHMDLDAKITVKKGMLDAPGELEMVNLQVKDGSGMVMYIPAKTLMELLKDKGNRVKVRFHVKGNLDDPQFNLRENLATRLALSLAESLGLPVKVVGEQVMGGATRGAQGIVEGLKSFEDLFRKGKEPKP
jgi:hypothetical protein